MNKPRLAKTSGIALAVCLAGLGLAACSESSGAGGPIIAENGYAIDVLELDGSTDLGIAPAAQIEPAEQSTIEFWVSAGWTSDPGFDPVIVSNPGDAGVSYLVAIDRDRDGLVVAAGEDMDAAPFDFSDGKMHHVGLIDYGDAVTVLVDDEVIAQMPLSFVPMESEGLYFGSLNGGEERFVGQIGAFRQWDVALGADKVRQYRLLDVTAADNPHPDLEHLAVISDFGNDRVVYIGE